MAKTLTEITAQLSEPFALQDIDLLPKSQIEKDGKTLCMALPYADPRVYQDRLNKVAPGEWSTPPPVALTVGSKLVVYVTVIICGVAHSDVGEAPASSENAGTESYAQAFKRACSQFGLGRYLYDLEKEWVPYNKQRKQIELNAAGIQNIVRKMYMKAGISQERREISRSDESATEQQDEPPPQPEQASTPTASEIDKLRSQWAEAFDVKDEEFEERWKNYKIYRFGKDIPDPDLQQFQRARINGDIVNTERKKQAANKKAS